MTLDQNTLIMAGILSALLIVGCALLMLQLVSRDDRVDQRLREANGTAVHNQRRADIAATRKVAVHSLLSVVAQLGGGIARSGLLSRKTLHELEQTLSSSGLSSGSSLGLFIGSKVLLVTALPVLAQVLLRSQGMQTHTIILGTMVAGLVGLMAPDAIIGKLRKRYLGQVEAALPDTLDLLLICAQSGLSLQPAILRVEIEIREVYPAIAWELTQTATELQFIADSRVALTNLGSRTGLDSLKRLTATLIQTMQYGTPLSEALRTLSAEMRLDTLNRFEERAARLPVLLTMPMILFIMPCVFAVVGAPAVIQLLNTCGG